MSEVRVEGDQVIIAGRDLPADFWPEREVKIVYRTVETVIAKQIDYRAIVRFDEGDMAAEPGDYIVTDNPPTHAWPVQRDVFEATYRMADAIAPE